MLLATVLSARSSAPRRRGFTIADLAPASSPMRTVFGSARRPAAPGVDRSPAPCHGSARELASDLEERLADTVESTASERFLSSQACAAGPTCCLTTCSASRPQQALLNQLLRRTGSGHPRGCLGRQLRDRGAALALDERIRQWFTLRAALHLDQIESDDLLGIPTRQPGCPATAPCSGTRPSTW